SKSLGNVIDPLDMISKYGADALRFSIISITAQGQDVYLAESRFELGRNFANKIWNASRFIMMNLKEDDRVPDLCVFFEGTKLTLPERWILSRFYSTLNYVSGCLAEYKFNEAANAIYEFLWHEFCDWYIEIAKPTITGRNSQTILYKILEKSLRMLHPFMPFITEEIWQKLPKPKKASGDSIMTQPWPHVQDRMISREDEEKMRELIEVITSIRNMRAVWNIEARVDVDVIINTNDSEDVKLLSDNIDLVKKLAKVSGLKVGKHSKPKSSAVSVIRKMEIFLPLEGLIDFEKEKARLLKEHLRMEGEMKGLSSRLKDRNFTSKAPKEIVDKQEERKAELSIQIKKMKDNLREISA
ncbi:MAG: class I tRNA ligase family protein, partial [Candidatus Omnitrophica bacterium]|nr:class I tRNA ligase family protein [Candidatus Omnitrophota bacterium]